MSIKNSGDILYSKGNNDECMTPPEAVYPILEFVEVFREKIIWCPFDKENSEFVKILQDKGFNQQTKNMRLFDALDNMPKQFKYLGKSKASIKELFNVKD